MVSLARNGYTYNSQPDGELRQSLWSVSKCYLRGDYIYLPYIWQQSKLPIVVRNMLTNFEGLNFEEVPWLKVYIFV